MVGPEGLPVHGEVAEGVETPRWGVSAVAGGGTLPSTGTPLPPVVWILVILRPPARVVEDVPHARGWA